MKRAQFLAHFLLPMLVALIALLQSMRHEPLTGELAITHLAWAVLFYSAPHLLWAAVAAKVKPSLWAWHAGFGAASCALLVVASLSVWGPRDQSGLPYQWLLYWPLAGLLLAIVGVGWLLAKRPHGRDA